MLIIGLTGNIASGKSEVARIFAHLGATVIDADELAREAVEIGSTALDAIAARWGKRVLRTDGSLNRERLRSIVFADDDAREALNAIVHPEVRRLRDRAIADSRARGDKMVVSVIPLLYEVGMENDFDHIVLVDAPESVRLERLVEHRGMDPSEAKRMMAAQLPAESKRARADFIIDNDAGLPELRNSVERVWRLLQSPSVH